jgi:hypothetical protein
MKVPHIKTMEDDEKICRNLNVMCILLQWLTVLLHHLLLNAFSMINYVLEV